MGDLGIIGGPDGPTVVFVSVSPDWWIWLIILLAVIAAVGVGVWLFLRRRKK